jgi:GT2 family glycosyltransferase
MAGNPLVSIVVLNYNGKSLIKECLDSLQKVHYKPLEIIVVDNHSSDDSIAIINNFSNIKLIQNNKNYGYAQGNNIGIFQASGKYVVTLNNDITVEPSFLDEPIKVLESTPSAGLVCCRQMSFYQNDIIDGLFHIIKLDLSFLPFGQSKTLEEDTRFLQSGQVISVNGGSAVLRKSMVMELGGFDARFFAYWDEVDLSMKAFIRGWRCIYVPEAVVYHKGSISFKKTGALQYFYRERNRVWFLYKYFPLTLLLKHLIFMIITELRVVRIFFFKLRKPKLYFRARLEAIKNLPCYHQERKVNIERFKEHRKKFELLKRNYLI